MIFYVAGRHRYREIVTILRWQRKKVYQCCIRNVILLVLLLSIIVVIFTKEDNDLQRQISMLLIRRVMAAP